jgi:hypothetical protein
MLFLGSWSLKEILFFTGVSLNVWLSCGYVFSLYAVSFKILCRFAFPWNSPVRLKHAFTCILTGGGNPASATRQQKLINRGEMDASIYNRVIMLVPSRETTWDTAPYFWMLGIIEMIQTAENCRVWRGKHMCSHLIGFPGSLGPLGLGQRRGKAGGQSSYPILQVHLWGHSKGAWWGSLFLATRPTLFTSALLAGGYCSPKLSLLGWSCPHVCAGWLACLLARAYIARWPSYRFGMVRMLVFVFVFVFACLFHRSCG